jgi:hypothetical protein
MMSLPQLPSLPLQRLLPFPAPVLVLTLTLTLTLTLALALLRFAALPEPPRCGGWDT